MGRCLGELLGLSSHRVTSAVKRDFTPVGVRHLLKLEITSHAVGVTKQLPLKSL